MQREVQCCFYFEDPVSNRKKLFQVALSQAKHGKVLYILPEELHELPELSEDLTSVSRHYMKMISFLYAKTLESLIESIGTLPEWQSVPVTIILDDLTDYCDKKKIQNACGLVAFLLDTVRSCFLSLNVPCQLCISVNKQKFGAENCIMLREIYGTDL